MLAGKGKLAALAVALDKGEGEPMGGKGKKAALAVALDKGEGEPMGGKGKKKPAKKPMPPMKKKGRDMGALSAFSPGNY